MDLSKMIGSTVKKDDEFTRKMRIHQGWWRTFVLGEDEGNIKGPGSGTVCNRINDGEISGKNFISIKNDKTSRGTFDVVRSTLSNRSSLSPGIINNKRLYNNLLSSQPLCFNLFGELKNDKVMAAKILRLFIPDISSVTEVHFEYVPPYISPIDNSAFDVAFEVIINGGYGFVGLECKYTDDFSKEVYTQQKKNKAQYQTVFEDSTRFSRKYDEYGTSEYDQLFRNELLASQIMQVKKYSKVITGLFYHHEDYKAGRIADNFANMLKNSNSIFKIISYREYIEKVLTLSQDDDFFWEQKEWIMMLWARYCALDLSNEALKQKINSSSRTVS